MMSKKTDREEAYSIILTDDNPVLRDELKQYIETDPELKITGEAANGLELLGHLYKLNAQQQTLPQLAILDISMPYLGGIETARQIKLVYPTVKVLFLSIMITRNIWSMQSQAVLKGTCLGARWTLKYLSPSRWYVTEAFIYHPALRKNMRFN